MSLGTDVVDEAESVCVEVGREFSRSVFFTGKIIFQREAGISACCTTDGRRDPEDGCSGAAHHGRTAIRVR